MLSPRQPSSKPFPPCADDDEDEDDEDEDEDGQEKEPKTEKTREGRKK